MKRTNKYFQHPDLGNHTECFWRESLDRLEVWMGLTRREMIELMYNHEMSIETLMREADEAGLFEWQTEEEDECGN